jgi:hypothetical protein
VSGTRGGASGSLFEIEDPRSIFTLPYDRQVIVYFEWKGKPGRYRIEGRWRDPSGQVVLTAPTDYEAVESPFGVYWTLALPENVTSGLWALEAHLGDQPVGAHTFEIRGGQPLRLSQDELFQCAEKGVALIESVGSAGEPLAQGVGTALDEDHIATSFPAIEAAAAIRARLPDGSAQETRELGAWSRREGWAILRVPAHGLTPIPRQGAAVPEIGGAAFVLNTMRDGGHVISETAFAGRKQTGPDRATFRLADWYTAGSPVMDTQCRLVGIVVKDGAVMLGSVGLRVGGFEELGLSSGSNVMPVRLLPPITDTTTLEQLAAEGIFMAPLSPKQLHVVSGVFAGRIDSGKVVQAIDQRNVFSRREPSASVFVTWRSDQKLDGMTHFAIYDSDNRMLAATEPAELKLRPGAYLASSWTVRVSALRPGDYRVDLSLDGDPVWRGYIRLTE